MIVLPWFYVGKKSSFMFALTTKHENETPLFIHQQMSHATIKWNDF